MVEDRVEESDCVAKWVGVDRCSIVVRSKVLRWCWLGVGKCGICGGYVYGAH